MTAVICITLISVEAERLFQVSILSCFSSCAIQIISPFFSGFIVFSCCFAGILINSLSVINLAIIFSESGTCLLTLSMLSFLLNRYFNFDLLKSIDAFLCGL